MTHSQRPDRRSIRLKGYDYSQPGAYFVTICVQDGEHLFGRVVDGEMRMNDAGKMVKRWWLELNRKFHTICTDVYVVMPNHFHGIVMIVESDDVAVRPNAGAHVGAPLPRLEAGLASDAGAHVGAPLPRSEAGWAFGVGADLRVCPDVSLSTVMQWFKTMTTNEYIRGVKTLGWLPFPRRLWQRNYYDHIVRNERTSRLIQQYIVDNPLRWDWDRYNDDAVGLDEQAAAIWRLLKESARDGIPFRPLTEVT